MFASTVLSLMVFILCVSSGIQFSYRLLLALPLFTIVINYALLAATWRLSLYVYESPGTLVLLAVLSAAWSGAAAVVGLKLHLADWPSRTPAYFVPTVIADALAGLESTILWVSFAYCCRKRLILARDEGWA
ncbi:hypothetical protein EVG20_g2234 [Dentipellis fragilis]|uniref:Uncharacterized protein n=1 Tax=Dentipellis fragilis TaxID=205917 RepID=A0A4Y9Z9T9_9AGAM|nr:hypothetical protein EVG20_g2234 [Dentipellis fragilis]